MAIIASINLILVIFDYSYIPLRNIYFRYFRYQDFVLTKLYDPIKGIEPHRETEQYLATVEKLKEQVAETGLVSLPAQKLLEEVTDLSTEMIGTNPFAIANKTGTLEKIKNRMREHLQNDSAKQSFSIFWSPEYLKKEGWTQEIAFYDKQIKPLIETNYFRSVGESGEFTENFWQIDIWFSLIFALDFLGRTWLITRRYSGIRWRHAMLWRWYDLFLISPVFRWSRVIPVAIRLDQAKLITLEDVKKQASQGFVSSIAEDITEVVVVSVITQMQNSIREGDISKMLSKPRVSDYIDINDTNEIAEISKLIGQLIIYQVFPQIKPEIEILLQYSMEKAINQTVLYQGISNLPGVESLTKKLSQQLVKQTTQVFADTLTAILVSDPVFDTLLNKLLDKLSKTISSEIQAKQTIQKIEQLLSAFLEEFKINYLENLSAEDLQIILQEYKNK
jgi:phenylpyruvate tautomerase PptA (4-oxalocrotonate tautomerase family)